MMVRDGCPIVKRSSFFHDPLYNEHFAIDGRRIARLMAERGYPLDLLYRNLARTAKPRGLATNLGLLEVLPDVDLGYDRSAPLRVVAVTHIFYPDMTDEIVDRLDILPGDYDLVVTTTDEAKRAVDRADAGGAREAGRHPHRRQQPGPRRLGVLRRLSRHLESDDYDILVKLHSKKNPRTATTSPRCSSATCSRNLLASPGYAANVLRLFQTHPSLGMVFPPDLPHRLPDARARVVPQQGQSRSRRPSGWASACRSTTPPRCRPTAACSSPAPRRCGAITAGDYTHEDFPDESGYGDGALTHVLERLMSYSVLSTGHHIREVLNADLAAMNYSYLEYRAIAIGELLPAYPRAADQKIEVLKRYRKRRSGGDQPGTDDLRPAVDTKDQAGQMQHSSGLTDRSRRRDVRGGAAGDARGRPGSRTVASAFNSSANSIGFFRWLLAFSVIFSHAGPLAGFYGQEDLGVQISDEQSLGGVAVAGFFFFSGFLITRSRKGTGLVRYFWRRCLRIMPAFWTALLLTAFVLAPIAWVKEKGSIDGFWTRRQDSPFTYFFQNMFLVLDQRNIAGMGESLPFAQLGGEEYMAALVSCPQPLAPLIGRHVGDAGALMEAMTRRYYRIRELETVEQRLLGHAPFVYATYMHEGVRHHVATTLGDREDLATASAPWPEEAREVPADERVLADLYVRDGEDLGSAARAGDSPATSCARRSSSRRPRRSTSSPSSAATATGTSTPTCAACTR